MQSFPKNVLTGLLIGSKTGKSPGQSNNHLIATHYDSSSTAMTSTPSSISGGSIPSSMVMSTSMPKTIQCKTEDGTGSLNLIVKPEILDTHPIMHTYNLHSIQTMDHNSSSHSLKDIDNLDKPYEKIVLAPQHHHPNYTLNPKLLEQPEMSVSPARGSTGLPGLPPVQASATQPLDIISSISSSCGTTVSSTGCPSTIGARRARVGKSMAREMMMQSHSHTINPFQHSDNNNSIAQDINSNNSSNLHNGVNAKIYASTPIKEQQGHNDVCDSIPPYFMSVANRNTATLIKEEDVKKECEDDVVVISDKSESETSSNQDIYDERFTDHNMDETNGTDENTMKTNDKDSSLKRRSDHDQSTIDNSIIDLDLLGEEMPAATVKRRKILEFHKNSTKKSPPNSYKSLIKPSNPKSYLCKAEPQETPVIGAKINQKISLLNNDMHSEIISIEPCTKSCKGNRKLIPKMLQEESTEYYCDDAVQSVTNDVMHTQNEMKDVEIIEIDKIESKQKIKNAVSTANPSIADEFPQALTIEKNNFMSSLEQTIERVAKGYLSDNELLSIKQAKIKNKLKLSEGRSRSESKKDTNDSVKLCDTKTRDRSSSSAKSKERSNSKLSQRSSQPLKEKSFEKKTPKKKTTMSKKTMKQTATTNSKGKNAKETIDEIIMDELLVNDSLNNNNNNNNNILIENNNKVHEDKKKSGSVTPTLSMAKLATAKKTKSRGSKFSNKKRHRTTRHMKEIEEIIIPRRTSAVPRWSNGWNWKGEPFQGKVFLNVNQIEYLFSHFLSFHF